MLAGGDDEKKKAAVPAEKSESGPDSGTEKSAGSTQAKRRGQALSPDKSTDDANDRVSERGEDGKFKSAKEKDGEGEKKPEPEAEDGPQKRINKAVKAQREAERKAEQLAREIEELKRGKPAAEPKKDEKKEPAKAEGKPRPKQEDFNTYEEYTDALTDWKMDQREAAKEKAERERKQAETNAAFKKAWDTKKDAARDKYDDYDEVMEEHGKTPVNQATHNFITESDIGPELGYYLASHRDEAAEIFALPPTKAVKAMAKIEDKLSEPPAEKKPAEDTKPKAEKKELPKPPRNVGGNATPKEPKLDDPDTDFGTFKRLAKAHLNRER